MINIQIIPFLPFIALILVIFLDKYPRLFVVRQNISPLFATLFLFTAFGLKNIKNSISLNILDLPNNFSFVLLFNDRQMLFLLLVGLMWFLVSIYSRRYFAITEDIRIKQFNILFLLVIGFLSGLVLSKNLLTALLFYQLLSLIIYLFSNNFASRASSVAIRYFGFFVLSTSSLLFLAAALIFKISGTVDFIGGGVFSGSAIDIWQFGALLFFYVLSLALIAFVPIYWFFGKLYHLSPPAIIIALLGFSLSSLILLFKVIVYIFGMKLFAFFMSQLNDHGLITIAIGFNLLALALLTIFSKNLKQMLTFLFFNQLIMVVMALLVFGVNPRKMQIMITSFTLSQMLIFFAIGNINLYLSGSQEKTINGIFHKLKITILLLIFTLLNFSGLVPAVGMIEKYWLFKEVITNRSFIGAGVVLLNILLCLVCSAKMIYPMLEISAKNSSEEKNGTEEIAREIELDLSLILPIVVLSCIIFALAFPPVANFFM